MRRAEGRFDIVGDGVVIVDDLIDSRNSRAIGVKEEVCKL